MLRDWTQLLIISCVRWFAHHMRNILESNYMGNILKSCSVYHNQLNVHVAFTQPSGGPAVWWQSCVPVGVGAGAGSPKHAHGVVGHSRLRTQHATCTHNTQLLAPTPPRWACASCRNLLGPQGAHCPCRAQACQHKRRTTRTTCGRVGTTAKPHLCHTAAVAFSPQLLRAAVPWAYTSTYLGL